MVQRRAMFALLVLFAVSAGLSAEEKRTGVSDATLHAYLTPGRQRVPVELKPDGTFTLPDIKPGTWTLEVDLGNDFLDNWVTEELKSRGWQGGGSGHARGERYVVKALDGEGNPHEMTFQLFTTVFNTENKGDYVKTMRWQHADRLSFKFEMGDEAGGKLSGKIERVVTVDL
jgi:hypothetical protein